MAFAEGDRFALLSKSVDDFNFVATLEGCQEAAQQEGDECVLLGGKGPAGPRPQVTALKNASQSGEYKAFAISVVMSDLLAEEVRRSVTVPVITFDSPFAAKDARVSRAYVGSDNIGFGQDLAKIVRQFRPAGGTVFIIADMHDPNLAQRVWGVRRELSGDAGIPEGQRLKGESGWLESVRSPWNSGDNVQQTLVKLSFILDQLKPDAIISVGQWPLLDSEAYRQTVLPYREDMARKQPVVVAGVGCVRSAYKELLDEHLLHGLVSIDFHEIGRLSYRIMRDLIDGKEVPENTYVPNTILMSDIQ